MDVTKSPSEVSGEKKMLTECDSSHTRLLIDVNKGCELHSL